MIGCRCEDGWIEVDDMPVPCVRCHPQGPEWWGVGGESDES